MLNLKIVSWTLGIFVAISFVVCVIYGLIVPSVPMQGFLEMVLPAFAWLTVWGFCLGLIESCLYGALPDSCSSRSTTCSPADGRASKSAVASAVVHL